jgi:LPS sulfotransferase NodH
MMPPHRSVIVCATPRTGSTLLCALLAASGVGGHPESWYRDEDRAEYTSDWDVPPDDPRAYLEAAIRAGTGPDGTCGLRIQAPTLQPLLSELHIIFPDAPDDSALLRAAFGPCHFIRTRRRDAVAQAVSRLKAEDSQVWHLDGTEGTPVRIPTYDATRLDAFIAEAATGEALWDAWFTGTGLTPVTLWYEDFAADPEAQVRRAMTALGLTPPPGPLTVPNRRMADAQSADWARRYRQERAL